VLRKLLITALVAGFAAAPAQAARTLLMPGVTYERQVQFTSQGPVAIHVLLAPKPGGLYSLKPVLSNGAIVGLERVTAMQRAVTGATTAGVNGDLFREDGLPSGVLLQSGALARSPSPDRSSIGIGADGSLQVERVKVFATWRGSGQRRALLLNLPPGPNGVSLFTSAWGPTTPAGSGATEAVLPLYPPATPNIDLTGTVGEIRQGGGTPIPPGGAVVVARGTGATRLTAEAPVGGPFVARLLLNPDWKGIVDAIGGGPALVRAGKPVFRHFEFFSTDQLARNPRTAVGQLADGRIILVVVDGRQPGYSVGMTNFDLAQALVRLGAVTASGLDGGGSSTMAFDGTLLNRPSDPAGERAVSEGLFVLYGGVYAPPPTEPVLSPNGDGVAETQTLAYELVRPARVTATLTGPDRVPRPLETADKPAGVYPLTWTGLKPDGTPEPEGTWRFSVSAIDDAAQPSLAERLFVVDRTLAALTATPALVRVGPAGERLRARFTVTRLANIRVTIETRAGAVSALVARTTLAPGTHTIEWDGRAAAGFAGAGSYVVRVAAQTEIGASSLTAPLTLRRAVARQSHR